jgi:succinate dehydrogenase/fumarate reductase flavoprotein subunit
MLEFDVIVVGGGAAGMRAALAASATVNVGLISKDHPIRSGSASSAGGINAPLDPSDDPGAFAADTVRAGDFLSEKDAVETLCADAASAVIEMENSGVAFDRDSASRLALRKLGGASGPRAAYGADWTGILVAQTLWGQLVDAGVNILDEWYLTRLLVRDEEVAGVVAMDLRSGELHAIGSRAVVLATGGAAGLYAVNSSPVTNTGDGLALAFREGLPLRDMEFVQFNPTGLHFAEHALANGVSISEAARSEGSLLRNSDGDRFMECYASEKLELAPRDVVSRAVQTEIDEGRGLNGGHISLDSTELGSENIASTLPSFYRLCGDLLDLDPAESAVPVAPAAHSSVGGIPTDVSGATALRGLYAVGECASTGVHGAGSLAGNGLTEALVYGRRSGVAAAHTAAGRTLDHATLSRARDDEAARIGKLLAHPGSERVTVLRSEMRSAMSLYAGVFRDAEGLATARADLDAISERLADIRLDNKAKRFNLEVRSALELVNMMEVAQVIVESARNRTESRGSHFRTDHDKRDDGNWRQHTLAHSDGEGARVETTGLAAAIGDPDTRVY